MKTTEENLIEKDTYLKERRIARADINAPWGARHKDEHIQGSTVAPLYLNQESLILENLSLSLNCSINKLGYQILIISY